MVAAFLLALLLSPVAASVVDSQPGRAPNELAVLAPHQPAVSHFQALDSLRPHWDLTLSLLKAPHVSVPVLRAQLPPQAFAAAVSLLAQPRPRLDEILGKEKAAQWTSSAEGLVPGVRAELARLDAEIAQSQSGDVPVLLDRTYAGTSRAPPDSFCVSVPESRKTTSVQLAPFSPTTSKAAALPRAEALTRLEINAPFYGVSGSFRVDVSQSGKTEAITAPQASILAASVARAMPAGTLKDESVTEIVVVSAMSEVARIQESPTGNVRRLRSADAIMDQDAAVDFRRVYVLRSALKDDFSFKTAPESTLFKVPESSILTTPIQRERRIGPLLGPRASVFVGGLISISAEPPEGFFAAATASELKAKGYSVKSAEHADVWLYRVPDSRPESYFDFLHPSADRPADTPRGPKFKIASGIGPAHNPGSTGGAEANLLWLGDEQNGALEGFLRTISKADLSLSDLYAHKGFVQSLSPTEVVVGGIDHAHAMTSAGFDAMDTDPEAYRRIYSEEYDQYLLSLFDHPQDAASLKSYLLATSRGCSQGCAICCSGGLSKFQFFSPSRMMRELEKIAVHARLGPGQAANVFFIDSNFNNNPKRLIEFADLYERSSLKGKFRFYVRHNTVNGFLQNGPEGTKVPNVELINAYARLGIRQVFMGVDSYDDAGTRTLKSSWKLLARKGVDTRPTYTFDEVRALVRAFEFSGLSSRGFFLTNNPWVSDLDRIDGYYNLLELWLENPHFSVDVRNRDVIRLKPFAGSPITDVAAKMENEPVKDGRFIAQGALGEMDELMKFSELDAEAAKRGPAAGLEQFRASINRLRESLEKIAGDPAARLIIQKLLARDAQLARFLKGKPASRRLLADISRFARIHRALAAFDPADQRKAFEEASASLVSGLVEIGAMKKPEPGVNGYRGELAGLEAGQKHTIKDVSRYLQDNLGSEAVAAARGGKSRFLIVVGDGQKALEAAKAQGWKMGERLSKPEGFHQVYRAVDEKGEKAYVIIRVNGDDRLLHVQSLLKLAGLPGEKIRSVGKRVSWKAEYLKSFRKAGYVPDAVTIGFANTAVDSILLRNKGENARHFAQMVANYERKHAAPALGQHDLDGLEMQALEFVGGKKLWLFNCMYGDLSKDLIEALLELGVTRITYMGTAGAVNPGFRVRDVVAPKSLLRADGSREELDWILPLPSVARGIVYQRVSTPNVETDSWLEKAKGSGVDLIEVELEHLLDCLRRHPEVAFSAALVVSDVLSGEKHKDMTEWGLRDLRALLPALSKILDATLGLSGSQDYRIKSYRTVPLVERPL